MRANNLTDVRIGKDGKLELTYIDGVIDLTPGDVSVNPMHRIPVFNVLRSNSKFKPVIEKWLWDYLQWKITFYETGDIDEEKEEQFWRRYLSLGPGRRITSGLRMRRP